MDDRSLPPPGHPMYDILQLCGRLPSTPTKIEKAKQRLHLLNEDEEATLIRQDQGLQLTPLEELDFQVKKSFDQGPHYASIKFHALQSAALDQSTMVDINSARGLPPFFIKAIPWSSCKLACTLVLLFACSCEPATILNALKFQSRSLGGLPTMADIANTPSSDLSKTFARAKKAAIDGKVGKTTVLGVSLVDIEMIERGENKSSDMVYSSFAHAFVLAIGREGLRVYQAWGEHGYRLDQYLMGGGSRLRSWKDAKKFLKLFTKLASSKGQWSKDLNDAYEYCFGISIDATCGTGKPQAPIVPTYRPWVRVFEIEDVQASNLTKWTWIGEDLG